MISWQEKDIEDYVCENYPILFDEDHEFLGRQVEIGVGIIDVLLFDRCTGELVVVEIKNKPICNNALAQIMRYIPGVEDYYAEERDLFKYINGVRGVLMGPSIIDETVSSLRMVQDRIKFHEILVSIDIDLDEKNYERNKESTNFRPTKFIGMLYSKLNEVGVIKPFDGDDPEAGD
ncbi:endonuclease NucS domain-containing protein [Cohnella sp. GCM10020058]|uniref:endonuclease NucS domain-containing protein n=1 Tax=Cohnella sp. GCM10020058 TaxID=3317330 RepID=UPI0036356F42